MEEFRRGRQARREVWYDENLVPGSTAARLAMRATDADPDIVQAWIEFVEPVEGDWLTYGQWIEGELYVSLEQGHGTLMSPGDWVQHYQWIERLWLELAKATEEHYDRDGQSATDLELAAQRRAKAIDEAIERARGNAEREYIVGIPGTLFARWDGERILGFGFTPPNVATPEFQYLDGPGDLPDGWLLNDYGSGFWLHLQQYLQTVLRTSGENAFACAWAEDGWRCKPAQ